MLEVGLIELVGVLPDEVRPPVARDLIKGNHTACALLPMCNMVVVVLLIYIFANLIGE